MYNLDNCTLFSSTITEQAVAGIIAGLTAAALIKILTWLTKPKLKMNFTESETYTIAPDQDGNSFLYIHLVIKNVRKTIAIGCRVFLLKLEEKKGEKFEEIPLKVHLVLKWANENYDKGFKGLEIPGNYRRRIDLVYGLEKTASKFLFYTEGGARGIDYSYPGGEYRFTLQATGENTNSITKKFIFKWEGNFVKENIIIEEESFLNKVWFKIKNIINLKSIQIKL